MLFLTHWWRDINRIEMGAVEGVGCFNHPLWSESIKGKLHIECIEKLMAVPAPPVMGQLSWKDREKISFKSQNDKK